MVNNAGDVVTQGIDAGLDEIRSSVARTLDANVERLILTGSASINGTGNALNNLIEGNSGANRLAGGGGTDSFAGGAGNDTYVLDSAGDMAVEMPLGTTIVSAAADGRQGTTHSSMGGVSGDGRFLAFQSGSSNLIPDGSGSSIYIKDLGTGAVTLVSTNNDGARADNNCQGASISSDGRYVAFEATATNLVTGDTKHPMPVVAGHEGAGVVEAIGDGVSDVNVGDHVVLSWAPSCGHCFYCGIGKPNLCDTYTAPIWAGTMLDGTTRLSRDASSIRNVSGL